MTTAANRRAQNVTSVSQPHKLRYRWFGLRSIAELFMPTIGPWLAIGVIVQFIEINSIIKHTNPPEAPSLFHMK